MGLGLFLCWEEGEFHDFEVGLTWILRAAEQGYGPAQYFVASEYALGENTPRKPEAAAYWYEKASAQGDMMARYNLAVMYYEGDGVPQNLERFQKELISAADGGEWLASVFLCCCYEKGIGGFGVDQDLAKKWKNISKKQKRNASEDESAPPTPIS